MTWLRCEFKYVWFQKICSFFYIIQENYASSKRSKGLDWWPLKSSLSVKTWVTKRSLWCWWFWHGKEMKWALQQQSCIKQGVPQDHGDNYSYLTLLQISQRECTVKQSGLHFPVMWPWANHLTFLCLSFPTSKTRKPLAPAPGDNLRLWWGNAIFFNSALVFKSRQALLPRDSDFSESGA